MRIGELAQRSGVAVETIRFYEAQGLLPAPLRLENNYRNYTRRHLARLHFIRHCRLLDMSLEEIAKLANLENAQGRKVGVISHTEQIRSQISPQIRLVKLPTGGRSRIEIV